MSCGLPVPSPAEPLTLRSIPADRWYHVYCTREFPTTALTFAEGWGDTRFAPITGGDGAAVHTYYVASCCAVSASSRSDARSDHDVAPRRLRHRRQGAGAGQFAVFTHCTVIEKGIAYLP